MGNIIHMVVMANVIDTDLKIHDVYDLKVLHLPVLPPSFLFIFIFVYFCLFCFRALGSTELEKEGKQRLGSIWIFIERSNYQITSNLLILTKSP